MVNYYSQHGEDFLLHRIFRDKTDGFFVEVGCIDGRRFSNTLAFEEMGWKGLCIEAHEGYIDQLKNNRPNSIVCHCAAGELDEDDVVFYANSRGTLSTLDRTKESYFKENFGEYFSGFEEQHVPKRRLDTLFREHGIEQVDILTIDIEGYEIEALKGIDFHDYKPLVLVIESDDHEHEIQLDRMLIPNGYFKSIRIGSNIFYLGDRMLEKEILDKIFRVRLTHTRHPLDEGGDVITEVGIDTHMRKSAFAKLNNKIKSLSGFVRKGIKGETHSEPPSVNSSRFEFFDMGFHGDKNLLEVVDVVAQQCHYFIETGTNVGSTLVYFARRYPDIQCLSCEPDPKAFRHASRNTSGLSNVAVYDETSQEFMRRLELEFSNIFQENVMFWLDAHGYGFKWPLREELAFITRNFRAAYIFIDDFKVPGLDCFGYDEFDRQICSFDHVKDVLNEKIGYTVHYPNYTERTSEHHPLRGWGLIEFGHQRKLVFSEAMKNKVRSEKYGVGQL